MRNLLITLFALFLFGCSGEQVSNEEDFAYTWKDEQSFSFTDIDNPMQGFSQEDEESLNKKFSTFIFEAIDREDVQFLNSDNQNITSKEVRALLTEIRNLTIEDPEFPGSTTVESSEYKLTADDIVQVVCKEDWLFNEKSFSIKKRVTHIGPVVYVYDSDGDVRGKKILFWIKLQ
jgi:DNA gyrase/topoisomerase IV subunit B